MLVVLVVLDNSFYISMERQVPKPLISTDIEHCLEEHNFLTIYALQSRHWRLCLKIKIMVSNGLSVYQGKIEFHLKCQGGLWPS